MSALRTLILKPLLAIALLAPAPLALAQSRTPTPQPSPTFGDVGRALMRDLQRAGEDAAGEALAQWIIASRNDAIRAGVHPIPAAIRTQLKGHIPEAVLAKTRYRIGSANEFSLAGQAFKGNAAAITLGEVILFRPNDDGHSDAPLWAHELVHVQQYERWGVRGFAKRYTLDHQGVEAEARTGAERFIATRSSPASGARTPSTQGSAPRTSADLRR